MVHVIRNTEGAIEMISRLPQPNSEMLDENHPEIQQFLKADGVLPTFDKADADFVRVIEDLIDTLIANNVIRHTDLPVDAQRKLMLRKGLRNRMSGALNLLGGDELIL